MEGYKRILLIGLIVIALGVIFSTTLSDRLGSLGIVSIAIGGLLFIARREVKNPSEQLVLLATFNFFQRKAEKLYR